jgi:hypothetical protein
MVESEFYSVEEIRQAYYRAIKKGEEEEIERLSSLLTQIEGEEPNPFDAFVTEVPFTHSLSPKPWYKDAEILERIGFGFLILLFPWLIFFSFRLVRYIIEGFAQE